MAIKKCAVTGATGHIGNVLIRLLLERGNAVRAIVLPNDNLKPIEGLNVEVVTADITDKAGITQALKGVDVVFHLAGIITIMPNMKAVLEKVNIEGTRNVVAACRAAGVRRLVYTSSTDAIAPPPRGVPIDESLPFKPESVIGDYAWSKARSSLMLLDESKKKGLDIIICCPTAVTGPYDFNVSNVGQLIIDYDNGRVKTYVKGAYDFLDVRDAANGLILAAEKGKNGRHYILSGAQVKVVDFMKELARQTGRPAPRFMIPTLLARTAGALASVYYRLINRKPVFTAYSIEVLAGNSLISSARARQELGFTSRRWQESAHDQLEWFRKQGMTQRKKR